MSKSIAVAGKGGTGKTTLTALIVKYLVDNKMGPVLAVDADPDANLGTMLGVKADKSVGDLREEILKNIKDLPAGMAKADYVEAGLNQIIEEEDGFDLLAMGRGEGPGCYCSLNHMIRKFSDDLMPSYEWIVMDNEAGLEHLSRRTTANIDSLLIVMSENPISILTAEKINSISKNLKNCLGNRYIILNMISDKRREKVMDRIAKMGIECIGEIKKTPAIEDSVFNGKPLLALNDPDVKESITKIMKKIGG